MRTATLAAIAVLVLVATAGTAAASRFQVQPTKIDLAGDHQVGSVTITNRSDAAVRFQITAKAWDEGADGEMKLTATEDLVVYPTLFTLAAGGSRAVRVASTAKAGEREVPYRLFVEELPARRGPDPAAPSRITMLTRMAIPVFLPPASVRVAGDVDAEVTRGTIAVQLRNRGTVHVRVATIRVIGEGRAGIVFDRSQAGWYLLAGGARRYQLPMTAAECARVTRVRVEVATSHGGWRATHDLPSGCGAS